MVRVNILSKFQLSSSDGFGWTGIDSVLKIVNKMITEIINE
jgi:hypothetical protein